MYYIYVPKSKKDDNLYIGCTKDVHKRIVLHNSGKVRSTKARVRFELMYVEEIKDKYEAFFKEKYYKTAKGKKEILMKFK